MTKDLALEIWAPSESVRSRFTKPVLFSFMEDGPLHSRGDAGKEWNVPLQDSTAVFVDAPASEGVAIGLSLATQGYRPIPLYNGCPAATTARSPEWVPAVVEVTLIMAALFDGAEMLSRCRLPASAPPVFLLDANRATARPGQVPYEYLDNRSFVSVWDVPPASFLKEHGIARAVVIHRKPKVQPDLLFILLDWQRAGIRIFFQSPWEIWDPQPTALRRPAAIVAAYHKLAMRFGFRKNHLDAFGDLVPPATFGTGAGS
jgi:hypothetical protein